MLPDRGEGARPGGPHQEERPHARERPGVRARVAPPAARGVGHRRAQVLPAGRHHRLQPGVERHGDGGRLVRVLGLHPAVPAARRPAHALQRAPRARVRHGRGQHQPARRARRGDHAELGVDPGVGVHPLRGEQHGGREPEHRGHGARAGRRVHHDHGRGARGQVHGVHRPGAHPGGGAGLLALQPLQLRGGHPLPGGPGHRADRDLRPEREQRGQLLLRHADRVRGGPHPGRHLPGPPGPAAGGRADRLLADRGLDHQQVPARRAQPAVHGRRAQPEQGEDHHRQRDRAAPGGRGVHGPGRVRERAQAGAGGHAHGLRHQRARRADLRGQRPAAGRAELAAPRAAALRLPEHDQHRPVPPVVLCAVQPGAAADAPHLGGDLRAGGPPAGHPGYAREPGDHAPQRDHAGGDPGVRGRGAEADPPAPGAARADRPGPLRAAGHGDHQGAAGGADAGSVQDDPLLLERAEGAAGPHGAGGRQPPLLPAADGGAQHQEPDCALRAQPEGHLHTGDHPDSSGGHAGLRHPGPHHR
mmetsp:Transcript_24480/g.38777  ORF Transcript_24480/g.38777 Transcript_24480/m.38777 type:complete len:531 (-) Transcript_24480:922-2514(-)